MRRSFTRKSGYKDSKLFVLVTEGQVTEHEYFNIIIEHFFADNSRIHVELLKRTNEASDPFSLLIELNEFKKKYKLSSQDELWLICDRDRWTDKMLSLVNQQCKQKGFSLAMSNPCFEIWLLLHLIDLKDFDQEAFDSMTVDCKTLVGQLQKTLGSYNKRIEHSEPFINGLKRAIIQSKSLDNDDDWPIQKTSRLWKLFESLSTLID